MAMSIKDFLDKWAFKAEMGTHRGEYEAWGHARSIRESMERDLEAVVKSVKEKDKEAKA